MTRLPAFLLSLLLPLLLLTSCSKEAPPVTPATADTNTHLMPLAVGNVWYYTRTRGGAVTNDSIRILEKWPALPYSWVDEYQATIDFYTISFTEIALGSSHYGYRNDTLVNGSRAFFDTVEQYYALPDQPRVDPSMPDIGYGVVVQQDITTSAGTFTGCYLHRYQSLPARLVCDTWFKRGVGIVKSEIRRNSVVEQKWELTSYTLVE